MMQQKKLANAIRALAIDAVEAAQSGHPGMPMGMADIAEVLWNQFLKHNPQNPHWFNRDRFVLSNGHGCMLLYALLHLTGYDLSIDDLKHFRQLHSKTPGHPEYGLTPGVETTTGPLGQGLAVAVGMAIAEKTLAGQFNRDGFKIVDHYTYAFVGDGCLMEGISHEVCSLAGALGLEKLIVFYDDNGISIDGNVKAWFDDDTAQRFQAYDWQVMENIDGHDPENIRSAIEYAKKNHGQPTLIICKTKIGYGSPNLAGSAKTHGSPLGSEEAALAKKQLGWHYPAFEIPGEIYSAYDATAKGEKLEAEWQTLFNRYAEKFPELATAFLRRIQQQLPSDFQQQTNLLIQQQQQTGKTMATRKAQEVCLNAYGPLLPELLGGSADLTPSNNTFWQGSKVINCDNFNGNYLHYGVREFGMFAIMNGIALHGGFIPYGGTFLTFVDYGRNALRLCAMMRQKVIFVLTHDSIGLGEDGPTHQPIEHAAILRLTPGLQVWRPADDVETFVAWQQAIEQSGPSCLLLTRQNLPHLARDQQQLENIQRGAYIIYEPKNSIDAVIIATGSEVEIALQAADELAKQQINVRVISMPSSTVFDQQAQSYQQRILPDVIQNRVAIEAAHPDFWRKYVGLKGKVIGLNRFGESAPYQQVYAALGITKAAVVEAVRSFSLATV